MFYVKNAVIEGAQLKNPKIVTIKEDFGCKALLQSSRYRTQSEARSTYMLMSSMNAAAYEQDETPKPRPQDGASWEYSLEHHLSLDTTQDSSQLLLQTVQLCDEFADRGKNSFQFWLDGAR